MEKQINFSQKIYNKIRTIVMKWFGINDFNIEVKVLDKPLLYQDIVNMIDFIFDRDLLITKISVIDEKSRIVKEKLFGSKLTLSTNPNLVAIYLITLQENHIEEVSVIITPSIEKEFLELLKQKEHIITFTR